MNQAISVLLAATLVGGVMAEDDAGDSPGPTKPEVRVVESKQMSQVEADVLDLVTNRIAVGKVKLRGAVVQWLTTDNFLQLFNPFAPARYGFGDQNLTRDPMTDEPMGMTFLAVEFGEGDR